MVDVPWQELAQRRPKASERLVTLLMLRLRERAQAVDGAGGDGGRDLFEFDEKDELVIYEAKSFTGRMNSGRRSQVVRSLVSAARHQPDHWDLLVPIDPNPAEQLWFDRLRADFPFVRNWRGLSWLDQHFAAHPDLVRYALQGSGDYILERIAEARAERDVLLGGIPDLLDRYRALAARAQEISPHYSVRTSVDTHGQSTIQLTPKNPDPTGQSVISFTTQFKFRLDDRDHARRRAQFEETMRFGGDIALPAENLGEVTIAAPKELGIDETFVPDGVRITSPAEDLTPPVHAQLAVQRASGIPLASLPVLFTRRVTGFDGGTLSGGDAAGFLQLRMRYDQRHRSYQLNLSFTPPEYALPHASLPVLRLIAQASPDRFLELVFAGDAGTRISAPISSAMAPGGWGTDEAQLWADAYADLAELQNRTGQFFAVPEDFTLGDAREVKEVLSLLNGEKVPLRADTVTVTVISEQGLDFMASASGNGKFRLAAKTESFALALGNNRIELGPCIQVFTMDKVLNMKEARHALAEDGHTSVRMRVDQDTPVLRYLGTDLP